MLKTKIISLYKQGLTYQEIADKLSCSKSTVCYHIDSNQKSKMLKRQKKYRNNNPIKKKIENFCQQIIFKTSSVPKSKLKLILKAKIERFHQMRGKYVKPTFTVDDVINKLGDSPACYLTGESIDLNKVRSYHFDHIIPRSRGGDNSLNNLGVCTAEANKAKHDKTPDEFFCLCKRVLEHNGYNVTQSTPQEI